MYESWTFLVSDSMPGLHYTKAASQRSTPCFQILFKSFKGLKIGFSMHRTGWQKKLIYQLLVHINDGQQKIPQTEEPTVSTEPVKKTTPPETSAIKITGSAQ